MNKILFEIDPDINYLYHMLSVARCGYDNAYGYSRTLASVGDSSALI